MKLFSRCSIPLFLVFFLLTGCSRAPVEELGNVNVVTGVFLEFSPVQQRYRLSLEIADFAGYEKSSDISAKFLTAEGANIAQALEQINRISEKELYLSHAKVILLGTGFQTIDVRDTIEYFLNHPDINSNTKICIAQTDLLSEQKETSDSLAQPIGSLLERDTTGQSPALYQLYQKENQQFSLPLVNRTEDALTVTSSAVFSDYRYQMTVEHSPFG